MPAAVRPSCGVSYVWTNRSTCSIHKHAPDWLLQGEHTVLDGCIQAPAQPSGIPEPKHPSLWSRQSRDPQYQADPAGDTVLKRKFRHTSCSIFFVDDYVVKRVVESLFQETRNRIAKPIVHDRIRRRNQFYSRELRAPAKVGVLKGFHRFVRS